MELEYGHEAVRYKIWDKEAGSLVFVTEDQEKARTELNRVRKEKGQDCMLLEERVSFQRRVLEV